MDRDFREGMGSATGWCPTPLEGLQPGQVWELNCGDELVPCVLLELYVGKLGKDDHDYWRCMSLESGKLFSATTRRWDPTYFGHAAREDEGGVPLVGQRLA